MSAIDIDRLEKVYDNGFRAVKGIDLPIRDQEFMVLVGPSGCGKTTTLRMIAGLEDISGGEIRIGGRVVNQIEPKDRDIAMVFQNYALYPHMTVRENMAYALKLRKVPRAQIEATVDETAAMLSLTPLLDRLPKALSGGQRQRVALGRAIVRKPQAFLFDEPLSNLDAKLRGEMRVELKTLQQRLQTTMVYVTHDQIEAMTLGDRITVMDRGEIQQVGTPIEIYDLPANRFVAGFIGTPPMNFLAGQVERTGEVFAFVLAGSGVRLPLTMPHRQALPTVVGRPTVLGLRPEHLAACDGGGTAGISAQIPAKVTLVELMGDHQYVHLSLAGSGTALVMKTSSRLQARVGDALALAADTTGAHVFADASDHARTLTLPTAAA